ncbi:MAG: hypothetical protein QOE90_464 [Thermoplasmata archaeon]|nr:hypothetical protein [Thermoplasmata archaeon]
MKEIRFDVEGESVAGSLHEPTGPPRGALVMVHGFLSQRTEFADAPAKLAQKGWVALAIDQRGFGASGGPRGILSAPRATADTLGAVAWLRREWPTLPVGLVAHSMGAVFGAAAMAAEPTIRAGVLGAPMKSVRAELGGGEFLGYRAANAISRAKSAVGLGPLVVPYKNRYKDLFADPAAARRAEESAFLTTTVSLANYEALLAMDTLASARRVKQPVLVLLAEHDKAVKHANSKEVYDALAGPKQLVTLDCGHSMFGDRCADEAVAHVDRWMGQHLR